MAKVIGMNANYKEVAGVLRTINEGTAFAREVLNKMVEAGSKRTFNSVNATLAAMATKGYVSKTKDVFGDKILTKYNLTDAELRKIANNAKANQKNNIVTSNNTLKFLTSYGFNVVSLIDEEAGKNNNITTLKSNFKNGKYTTIFMLESDEETELIKNLRENYNAKIVKIDNMNSLSQENLNAGNDYLMIMNQFIDSIRTATN